MADSSRPKKSKGIRNIFWWGYFSLYLVYLARVMTHFYRPGGHLQGFYQTLIAFDRSYLWPYIAGQVTIQLNVFAVLPFFLFLTRLRFFPVRFWQAFFFLRLFFEAAGHLHGLRWLQAERHDDIWLPALTLGSYLALVLPSYAALFWVAFLDRDNGKSD